MDLLEEENWSLMQYVPRTTPPPLCINGAIEPKYKKIYLFGNKINQFKITLLMFKINLTGDFHFPFTNPYIV